MKRTLNWRQPTLHEVEPGSASKSIFIATGTFNMCNRSYESVSSGGQFHEILFHGDSL